MLKKQTVFLQEEGMVLVFILLIISLLTLAGIAAINTSITEAQTATNHMQHKISFYAAEGGLEVASELLEQNLACPSGFKETEEGLGEAIIGTTYVTDLLFWKNLSASDPSDEIRDIYFPYNYGTKPHTNISIGGSSEYGKGSALQMAAGYEGKGKGSGGGGANILYDIHVQHKGISNSVSEVKIQWRHVIGQEDDCKY